MMAGLVLIFTSVAVACLGLSVPLAVLVVIEGPMAVPPLHPIVDDLPAPLLLSGLLVGFFLRCLLVWLRSRVVTQRRLRAIREADVEALGALGGRAHLGDAAVEPDVWPGVWLNTLVGGWQDDRAGCGGRGAVLFEAGLACGALTVLVWVCGWIGAVPIAMILVAMAMAPVLQGSLQSAEATRWQAENALSDTLLRVLEALPTIKAISAEGRRQRRFERVAAALAGQERATLSSANTSGAVIASLPAVGVLAVGVAAVLTPFGVDSTTGQVACVLVATYAYLSPMADGLVASGAASDAQVQTRALASGGATGPRGVEPPQWLEHAPQGGSTIEVHGLTDRGRAGHAPRIEDVGLSIAAGEIVGFVATGDGAPHRFMDIVAGLRRPDAGHVVIDGVDVTAEAASSGVYPNATSDGPGPSPTPHAWSCVLVPQHVPMFIGAFEQNVTVFSRGASARRAMSAATSLGLDAVAEGLPDGWQTRMTDAAGSALPQGVRQRIGIARALAVDPSVLILSDADAGLDREAAGALQDLLVREAGHRTILVVSRRPSLLALCGRRFLLVGGRLVPWSPDAAEVTGELTVSGLVGSPAAARAASGAEPARDTQTSAGRA